MAIIIGGLGIPKFKRGTVFGQGRVPLTILCLGFITFIKIDVKFVGLMDRIVESGMDVDDFLIKNSNKLANYREQAYAESLEAAKVKYEDDIEYYKNSMTKYYNERNEYSQKVYKLESALNTLIEFKEGENETC